MSIPSLSLPSRRLSAALTFAAAMLLCGCAGRSPWQAAQVASGFASHHICTDVFVTGLDAERARAERVRVQRGMGLVDWAMRVQVDAMQGTVRSTIAGGFPSLAVHRAGQGCRLVEEGAAMPELPARPSAPDMASGMPGSPPMPSAAPATVAAGAAAEATSSNAALQAALARAFDEPAAPPFHHTLATVVMRDGALLAERYASGVGPRTPILGFSASKSITHALIGILVRQGRLSLSQPVPIDAWAAPGDPRGAITVEQLLRQTSGLDMRQDNSGFDPNALMLYVERDKAAFVAGRTLFAPPGTAWNYTDGHYLLLSRLLRDAVGGTEAEVRAFAQRELFGPLGMAHTTMEFDTTGTPMGASFFLASARDWARLGQLYLDDGVVDGRRLLPEGWTASARTPTLDTGYGAGWWTNALGGRLVPHWGVPWGLPHAPGDAYFARGHMGQFVVVVPSRRLVIVRLAISAVKGDDIEAADRLVGEVLSALAAPPAR